MLANYLVSLSECKDILERRKTNKREEDNEKERTVIDPSSKKYT